MSDATPNLRIDADDAVDLVIYDLERRAVEGLLEQLYQRFSCPELRRRMTSWMDDMRLWRHEDVLASNAGSKEQPMRVLARPQQWALTQRDADRQPAAAC
jgi:hypothetical protein